MTYEKNLEDKIEKIERHLHDTQEVSDSLAETLNDIKKDCKLCLEGMEFCIDVLGDDDNISVCDAQQKSYWNLQSVAATIHTIIEEIENILDDYGIYKNE